MNLKRTNDTGLVSLTDIYATAERDSLSDAKRKPGDWARESGADFIEFVADSLNADVGRILKTQRGKGGGLAVTMTSLELVDFINEDRKQAAELSGSHFPSIEFPSLRHDHFMAKVPKVLGESNAPKFLGTQVYGNNNTRDIYTFPKREACLMAMSYSYELHAWLFPLQHFPVDLESLAYHLAAAGTLFLAFSAADSHSKSAFGYS